MASNSETVTFEAVVDTRGANKALGDFGGAMASGAGPAAKLAAILGTVEKAGIGVASALRQANDASGRLGSLKGMQEGLSKSAGALAALSMAAGQGDSQMAKLVQSGAALGAAFAAGPMIGGITAVTFAVGAYSKIADEAAAANDSWRASGIALSAMLREQSDARVRPAVDALRDYSAELRNFGKTSREVAIDEAKLSAAIESSRLFRAEQQQSRLLTMAKESQEQALALRADNGGSFFGGQSDEFQAAKEKAQVAAEAYRVVAAQVGVLSKNAADARVNAGRLVETLTALGAKERGAAGRVGPSGFRPDAAGDAAAGRAAADAMAEEAAAEALAAIADQAADDALEADITAGAARVEAARSFEDLKTSITRDAADERTDIAKAEAQAMADIAMQGAGMVVGVSSQLLADLITGQDKALEAFGVSVMAQAGQALVGYGIQAIGRGVLEASGVVTAPLAAASFATGAGLIAAGVGLGGASAALGQISAGGSLFQKLPDDKAAKTSTGVNRGAPRAGKGGASSINVTVIYGGASGPTADQGARAVVQAFNRAEKRGAA